MAKMLLRVGTQEDREFIAVRLDMDGEQLGWIELDAPGADDHIKRMSDARALLKDEVVDSLDPGARVVTVVDPEFTTMGATPQADVVLLALRHPGLGWLGFGFPREKALALAKELRTLAAPPRKPRKKP
jgi:hypothetical protein